MREQLNPETMKYCITFSAKLNKYIVQVYKGQETDFRLFDTIAEAIDIRDKNQLN